MGELIAFLRARFDEEEAIALTACGDPDCGVWAPVEDGVDFDQYEVGGIHPATAAHIARHDPARVLREVDAKRRIIAECIPSRVGGPALELSDALGEVVLLFLALPYSDHPDYREEWAP